MKGILVLFFTSCLLSCGSPVPNDIIQPAQMKSVLWDLMQADEMADFYAVKDSSVTANARRVDLYQKVFTIHQVTRDDFQKSLRYYENNPSKLKIVLDSLQKFGERLQKTDSIKNIPPVDSTTRLPPVREKS